MDLKKQYREQQKYRRWMEICDRLPLDKGKTIIDLGCGTGEMSAVLAERAGEIIAVDRDENLLEELRKKEAKNIRVVCKDIRDISYVEKADGIFSSFAIAYFPNMEEVLRAWTERIRAGGFICLIEIDDLLRGHGPLSEKTYKLIGDYEKDMKKRGVYDFRGGRRMGGILKDLGMEVIIDEDLEDAELTSSGVLEKEIYTLWKKRMERIALNGYYKGDVYEGIKREFLKLLRSEEHENNTRVRFVVAVKGDV